MRNIDRNDTNAPKLFVIPQNTIQQNYQTYKLQTLCISFDITVFSKMRTLTH